MENYLDECIQSVLKQTHKNFEIILVDDGSTDKSGCICDAYKEKDDRIQVIHKQNGGVSEARNTGMALAKGEYIAFLDSDDLVHPKMYEFLLQAMIDYDADLVSCGYKTFCYEEELSNNFTDMHRYTFSKLEDRQDYLSNFLGWKLCTLCMEVFIQKRIFDGITF